MFPSTRRIAIVDDQPLVRRGLTALIEGEGDLAVCAEAATLRAGLEAIAGSGPDLVIVDLPLGDEDGVKLIEAMCAGDARPPVPVLVLTVHDGPAWARRAFGAGARGYATKREPTDTLLLAIRRVLDGGRYVSPGLPPDVIGE